MGIVLAVILFLTSVAVSLGQDIGFGDTSHPALLDALRNPAGTQFATWDNSKYLEIWPDSDGLRLMLPVTTADRRAS